MRKNSYCLLIWIALWLPLAAFAAVGGNGSNTTTFTNSTKTNYHTTDTPVSQRVDTFSTELIARMQGGPTLYDQTFNAAFADPLVQAAIVAARAVLTGSGASSSVGPTLLSSSASLVSSITQTSPPVVVGTNVTTTVNVYIGPQTIFVGPEQSQAFVIAAGGEDIDTLVSTDIFRVTTTTTTNTFLNRAVYELVGISAATAVPLNPWVPIASAIAIALLAVGWQLRRRQG